MTDTMEPMAKIEITKAGITYEENGPQQLYLYVSNFPEDDDFRISFLLARSQESAEEQANKIGGEPWYLNTMSNLLQKLEVLL